MRFSSLVAWIRLWRSKFYPWTRFLAACWQFLGAKLQPPHSQGLEQCPNQATANTRLLIAFAQLDHFSLVSLLNDCLW